MLREAIKQLLSHTPYEVRRRSSVLAEEAFDAIEHNSRHNMNEVFARDSTLVTYLDEVRVRQYQLVVDLIAARIGARADGCIGDVACGPGALLKMLHERFPQADLRGYDFAPSCVDRARREVDTATVALHDIYEPLPAPHDVTVCTQTLEHLLEPEAALTRLLDGTRTGGWVILTVPDGRLDSYRGHINFWSPESWQAWVARNVASRDFEVFRFPKDRGAANLAAAIRA